MGNRGSKRKPPESPPKLYSNPTQHSYMRRALSQSCKAGPAEEYQSNEFDEKWRAKLSVDEFRCAREHATEPAFIGRYYKHKADGIYTCVCCETELFSSKTKYNSGSGWPSFYAALKSVKADGTEVDGVIRREDTSNGMKRVEILCKNCGSHLGHVFNDGPNPTGERFCVNSLSLKFRAVAEKIPSKH